MQIAEKMLLPVSVWFVYRAKISKCQANVAYDEYDVNDDDDIKHVSCPFCCSFPTPPMPQAMVSERSANDAKKMKPLSLRSLCIVTITFVQTSHDDTTQKKKEEATSTPNTARHATTSDIHL